MGRRAITAGNMQALQPPEWSQSFVSDIFYDYLGQQRGEGAGGAGGEGAMRRALTSCGGTSNETVRKSTFE